MCFMCRRWKCGGLRREREGGSWWAKVAFLLSRKLYAKPHEHDVKKSSSASFLLLQQEINGLKGNSKICCEFIYEHFRATNLTITFVSLRMPPLATRHQTTTRLIKISKKSRKAEEKNLKNTFNNRPKFYDFSSKTFLLRHLIFLGRYLCRI